MTLATTALNCAKMLGRASADGTSIVSMGDEIKAEIAETIRFYNRKPWALTEFRGLTLDTVASTTWYSTVDLTSGDGDQDSTNRTAVDVNTILRIQYMRYGDQEIHRRAYRDLEAMLESTSSGGNEPYYYTVYAGQIGLWPVPTSALEIYLSAVVKAPVPTSDNDTSIWLTEAGELIEAAACKRVCTKHLRDNERAAQFEVLERDAASAFSTESMLKSGSGRIKAHC